MIVLVGKVLVILKLLEMKFVLLSVVLLLSFTPSAGLPMNKGVQWIDTVYNKVRNFNSDNSRQGADNIDKTCKSGLNLFDKNCSPMLLVRGGAFDETVTIAGTVVPFALVKILLQLSLTLLNVCSWYFPLINKRFSKNATALSRGNCFAGGIFLMLSMGHLIPHAVDALVKQGGTSTSALQYTLIGFLAIFFIEKIAFQTDEAENTAEAIEARNGKLPPKSAIVLCSAMCLHSLVEAASLGLAIDTTAAGIMSASIALHQPAESIALLVAFLKTNLSQRNIIIILSLYSMVGVFGVMCGVAISKIATPYVEAVVVAITAGTFLYVGAAEVKFI